jgi:hypothetical protein
MNTLTKTFQHRTYARYLVQFPMMYLGQTVSGQGVVRELSGVGCQVLSTTPMSEGTTLSVRLALPNDQEPLVIERATVKWVKGLEFGLTFDPLDQQQTTRLQQVIEERLAQRSYSGLRQPHTNRLETSDRLPEAPSFDVSRSVLVRTS